MNLAFPFHVGPDGALAGSADELHVRQLIEQVLFTAPGERVNRPDFGCGLANLVFEQNGSEMATVTQVMVQGALQHWLSELIQVESVRVSAEDAVLRISVQYVLLRTRQRQLAHFIR